MPDVQDHQTGDGFRPTGPEPETYRAAGLERVLDALDIETFLITEDEREAKNLILASLQALGFSDIDVVDIQQAGPGARVRARAYLHRPGTAYPWLGRWQRGGEKARAPGSPGPGT